MCRKGVGKVYRLESTCVYVLMLNCDDHTKHKLGGLFLGEITILVC